MFDENKAPLKRRENLAGETAGNLREISASYQSTQLIFRTASPSSREL